MNDELLARLDCEMSEACCQCQGLRAEIAALKAAAAKVTCWRCEGEGILNKYGQPPCPDCADLRALLKAGKP